MMIKFSKKQIVLAIIASILLAGGVFAQTEVGQEVIGSKETVVEGFDNSLLYNIDLDKYDMNFKIEKIEEDSIMYFVTYTYTDIIKSKDAWVTQSSEKIIKLSKNGINDNLDIYLAKEFKQLGEDRLSELKKAKLSLSKEETRTLVEKYSGLVGKTLDIASGVFPGYESKKITELPPVVIPQEIISTSTNENLENVYSEYIDSHPSEVEELDNQASSSEEQIESQVLPADNLSVDAVATTVEEVIQ